MSRNNLDLTEKPEISLKEAIEMGEYNPEYLSTFSEWQKSTKNMQWQMIKKALRNRKRLLRLNYAEIFNQLDFSKKPGLKKALKNVQKQIEKMQSEEDRLLLEYSKV